MLRCPRQHYMFIMHSSARNGGHAQIDPEHKESLYTRAVHALPSLLCKHKDVSSELMLLPACIRRVLGRQLCAFFLQQVRVTYVQAIYTHTHTHSQLITNSSNG